MRAARLLIIFLAAGSGCASSGTATSSNEIPVTHSTQATLKELVEEAKADAAQRTGKSVEEITVVSAERVSWSDGSMGCPMPGRMYPQVVIAGYRILLRVGDQNLDYHAGSVGRPVLCPAERVKPPLPSRET